MYNLINKQKIIIIIAIIIALLSVLLLYTNKVFKFAEYHYQIDVSIVGKDINKKEDYLNKLITNLSPVKIDRRKSEVFFEQTTLTTIQKRIDDLSKDYKDLTVNTSEVLANESSKNVILSLIIEIIIIYVTGSLTLYYFIFRFNKNISSLKYIKIIGLFSIIYIYALIIQLGIISLISLIYQIKNIDIISIYTSALISCTLVFLTLYKFKRDNNLNTVEIYKSINNFIHRNFKLIIGISILILATISLGLGVNFVITAILIIVSFVISMLSFFGASEIGIHKI